MSWEVEISKACFNPKFSRYDLEKSSRFLIEGKIYDNEHNLLEEVKVSNIDESSCFVILNTNNFEKLMFKEDLFLSSSLEGVEFFSRAKISSIYDNGLGFELVSTQQSNKPEWSELYKVCLERGIFI